MGDISEACFWDECDECRWLGCSDPCHDEEDADAA